MAAVVADPSQWKAKRRRVFHSVFQTEITQPTPYSTPSLRFPDQGQPFGGPVPGSGPGGTASTAASFATDVHDFALGAPTRVSAQGKAASLTSTPPRNGSSSFLVPAAPPSRGAAGDQIQYDRAWHVVTSRIALPASVAAEDSFGTLAPESQLPSQDVRSEADFQAALAVVLDPKSQLPRAAHTEDVLAWHTRQVRRHFVQNVLPMVAACADAVDGQGGGSAELQDPKNQRRYYEQHMAAVQSSVRTLEAALRLYFYGLSLILRGLEHGVDVGRSAEDTLPEAETVASRFRRDVHALVGNSATPALMLSIRVVFARLTGVILGIHGSDEQTNKRHSRSGSLGVSGASADADSPKVLAARQRLHNLVESLFRVGLAGERFQILLAETMDKMMSDFVKQRYAGVWTTNETQQTNQDEPSSRRRSRMAISRGPSSSIVSLQDWVENQYARLALEVLGRINEGDEWAVSLSDVKKWKEVGLGRLAALRISELFDIVLNWPASKGGLEDLRACVTTPQRRAQVVAAFSATLQRRLLHPARSTLDILRVYIALIHTFHALDRSGVLLGGAVGPLQMYLCQRDDAVRNVVTGLLASPEEVEEAREKTPGLGSHPTKLVELAVILNDPAQQRRQHVDDEDLDWDDMDWVPDPVDAGPNYKRPKTEDVIGSIISALGSQDVFIKEFQNIIAERLLSAQPDFTQEIKVLNLLKKRFGEAALQNCDVMIKDIQDSRRVDTAIRRAQLAAPPTAPSTPAPATTAAALAQTDMAFHARILSRLFWPANALDRDAFLLPRPVAEVQRAYEGSYESLKASRRLAWLDRLGQATVELQLADRDLTVDCATYEAAVVYAFQTAADEVGQGADAEVRRSAEGLVLMLRMDEDLVAAALAFWVRQGVLRSLGGDLYGVVETREGGNADTAPPAAARVPAPGTPLGAAKTDRGMDAAEETQRTVYWQFIVGMLTNAASSMPLGQITMMMKMLIAEGFPWSNEELQEFLAEKVAEGEMEVVGGKYRLVKK